jgi:hypothetical protein
VVKRIAREEVRALVPRPVHGQISAIDLINEVAVVDLADGSQIEVGVPADTTLTVGVTVRVSGTPGDRYIEGAGFVGSYTGPPGNPHGSGWDPTEVVPHSMRFRIATTNLLGPSTADELAVAHLILNGTEDAAFINYVLALGMFDNPIDTIWLDMGSGFYRFKSPIDIPGGGALIVKAAMPTHQFEGSGHTTLWVGQGFPDGEPIFRTDGPSTNLNVDGVNITVEPGSPLLDAKEYELTNCNLVTLDDVSAGQGGVCKRIWKPDYTTGQSIFIARRSFLRGDSTLALIRAGYGTDATASMADKVLVQDSTVANESGPAVRIACENFDISRSVVKSVGAAAVDIDIPASSSAPSSYVRGLSRNLIETHPTTEGSITPTAAPFVVLNNARGVLVKDNLGVFVNYDSGTAAHYPTDGNLVVLSGHSVGNDFTGNSWTSLSGDDWSTSGNGTYAPGKISVGPACSGNRFSDSHQLLIDEGQNNEYPIESYVFSKSGTFDPGPTGRFLIRKRGYLYEAVGTLTEAGTADTQIDVIHENFTIGTLIIPAGDLEAVLALDLTQVNVGDSLYIDVVSVNTGDRDLVVGVRSR